MKLLILETVILTAGELVETDDSIISADAIFPKHVIPGWRIVEVSVQDDFTPVRYEYVGGAVVKKADLPAAVKEAREAREGECDRLAKAKRDGIVAGISPAEMASWPIKRAEAVAWRAKGASATSADAPNLATEATARGLSLADLVGKVLTKADRLATSEAQIAGTCGKHQDVIKTLATVAAVESYDIQTGWPA